MVEKRGGLRRRRLESQSNTARKHQTFAHLPIADDERARQEQHNEDQNPRRNRARIFRPVAQARSAGRTRLLEPFAQARRPTSRNTLHALRQRVLVEEIVVDDPLAPLQLEPIQIEAELRQESGWLSSLGGVGSKVIQP